MSIYVILRLILDTNRLMRPNFFDWVSNFIIVLKVKRLTYVLNKPLPKSLAAYASERVQRAYKKHLVDNVWVGCNILTSMSPELQK